MRHYRYECGIPQRFECPYCKHHLRQHSSSKRRRSLEEVYSESGHLNKRYGLYECPSCGNLYKWKKSMLAHLRHQCKQPPRFECTYCPVKNYQKGHIIRHLRVHHPNLSPLYYDWKLNNVYRL
ncbi:longitudinals lacking protein, isoforms N/O/W/X/Y-like [Temnothorax curvispinosus]|uniref:Longitudinals lacking protein, isoforms N/O/W/X/Y-like n=1 Tax=Temnothorax curvispinosus TaxID=300111 RepID=A0A6J1R5M9_9HYME|nr:longitudinals lacking protein, isoforms N/O/W/X/Y-like [Temnothorax curvispinosus]